MDNIEELKSEIELLQKKLELLKLIKELEVKLDMPKIEYVPYPVYPTYPTPVYPYQPWHYNPITTCDTFMITSDNRKYTTGTALL